MQKSNTMRIKFWRQNYYDSLTKEEIETLSMSIIAGLPGSEEEYSLEKFRNQLEYYETINKSDFTENLIYFRTDYPSCRKIWCMMYSSRRPSV